MEKGADPQQLTSAEFAAMVDFDMLPELRACYGEGEDFDNACKAFATRIGQPDRWRSISLPAYVSWDSATIHPWARQLLCAPRVSSDEINSYVNDRIRAELGVEVPAAYRAVPWGLSPLETAPAPPQPRAQGVVQSGMLATLQGRARPAALQPTEREREEQRRADAAATRGTDALNRALLKYSADNGGADFVDVCMRDMARTNPAMRCIWPQQWMPLCKVTPDIHSPVEHMVGTIKHYLKRKMRENLCAKDDLLFQASTYQDWVLAAVEEKGNGEAGRHHITRSVDKQKCICMILAAPKTEIVTLEYTFMGKDTEVGNKRQTHRVRGAAGHWITISKWT